MALPRTFSLILVVSLSKMWAVFFSLYDSKNIAVMLCHPVSSSVSRQNEFHVIKFSSSEEAANNVL
jgi:hypothetical protein